MKESECDHEYEDIQFIESKDLYFSKIRVIKNVVVLCGFFLLILTAFECLGMLQSTLNHDEGIGVDSQSIVYGFFCLSSLFFPKYFIKKFGCKPTILLSACAYVPYMLSNMYPHWALMVPTAILCGLGAALLWGSQSTYLNELAILYAVHTFKNDFGANDFVVSGGISASKKIQNGPPDRTNTRTGTRMSLKKTVETTTAIFFGIFGMASLSTVIFSNLLSYLVLKNDALNSERKFNTSCVCGAQFCNQESDCFEHNLLAPSQGARNILTGLCVSLYIGGLLLLLIFLDALKDKKENVYFSLDLLMATSKHLKKRTQIALIPLTFYVGMIQGFYSGDFTMSYVGCAWGTYHVGLVSMCYGAACAISSPLYGLLVKLTGRLPIFTMAFAMNLAAEILLLTFKPTFESPFQFFLIGGLWGVSLGAFWSQLKAMYGFLFKDEEEAAFAAFHLWYSLGVCLSFAYSNHFCTYIKIYALMSTLVLGMVGYLWVELRGKHLQTK